MSSRAKNTDTKFTIAVIGGSRCTNEEATLAQAVGRELAKRGATLVCGGLTGIMEAACRGATSESGLTIGILPGDDMAMANPYVQISIASGVGFARNIAVVKSAHAVIAIDGDYGTLTEIAFALKSDIPVVGLNTWVAFRNGKEEAPIVRAKDPLDAVEKAITLAKRADIK